MKRLFSFCALVMVGLVLSVTVQAKTLKMAYDADPASLDPHAQLSGGTLRFSHMVFDPLVRWTRDFAFEPRLAERWERLNGTTVRFYLRRGVTFHSGNPMTARDVVWTFNRLKTSPDYKGLFAPFAEARAIDDHTVDLVTSRPYPLVLNIATYLFPMDSEFYSGTDARGRPKDELDRQGRSFASSNASGTGPFIVRAREQGVRVEFTRFGGYWDKRSPGNVSRIVLTAIKAGPARVAALLSGNADFIAPVPLADLERIKRDDQLDLVTTTSTRLITLQLNQKRVPQFKDRRVRQAIAHAVDNVGIAKKIMRGFATAAAQLSPQGYAGHNAALRPRFDLRQARDLMKEAGHEFGFSVTMMAPNDRYVNDAKIAEAVAAMLAKISIKVDLKTMPQAQYWPKFAERAADIMMIGWHPDTEDSANFSEVLFMTPDKTTGFGRYNAGSYSNPTVDRLVQQSQAMTDLKGRAEILREIERTLYEDAAFVPLHWQHLAWAARKGVHIERVVNAMNLPYLGDLVID
ncbi:MAG: ABC transporter substrate-binding protein [Methyloligellaceae bacterium]